MVLTGEGRLEPDIWSKTINQAENTKDVIRRIWAKEAHHWQKANRIKTIALSPSV